MEVYKCRLLQSFRAPKKIMGGKDLTYKFFKQGEIVEGSPYNQASTPANYARVFKTTNGYIIPESYLHIIGSMRQEPKFDEAQVVEDKDLLDDNTKETAKKITNSYSKKFINDTKDKSKYMVNGAMIGAGVGLVYALMKGQNKLVYSGLGALLGGFAGKTYHKTKI